MSLIESNKMSFIEQRAARVVKLVLRESDCKKINSRSVNDGDFPVIAVITYLLIYDKLLCTLSYFLMAASEMAGMFSFVGLLLACLTLSITASADPGQTGLPEADTGFTGFSEESNNEQSSVEHLVVANDRSRRNGDMEISELELAALHQVYNGVRVVRRLTLKICGRPPRPSVKCVFPKIDR